MSWWQVSMPAKPEPDLTGRRSAGDWGIMTRDWWDNNAGWYIHWGDIITWSVCPKMFTIDTPSSSMRPSLGLPFVSFMSASRGNTYYITDLLWGESNGFPHKGPLMWSFYIFSVDSLNKLLNNSPVVTDLRLHDASVVSLQWIFKNSLTSTYSWIMCYFLFELKFRLVIEPILRTPVDGLVLW